MERERLTCMADRGTAAMLLRLNAADGPLMMTDLADDSANYQTRRKKVDAMEDDGLVDIKTEFTPSKTVRIYLTAKGKGVAVSLATINAFVSPEKPISEKSLNAKYAETILRTLRDGGGKLKQADVLKKVPNYRTVVTTLDLLKNDGLLTITPTTESYRTFWIELTPLGSQTAEVFEAIHRMIRAV